MLWLMMSRHIRRYLLVNTKGREDGAEKAEHHIQMSYIYVASRMGVSVENAARIQFSSVFSENLYRYIHDSTQALTSHMDEVIGFPLEEGVRPDYDTLAPLFFKEFIRIADEAFARVESDINETRFRHISAHLLLED